MRPATAALGLALLMLAVAFVVPGRTAQAVDLTGMYGGNLRMALLAAPSWNPLANNPAEANVNNLVWDTLARPDPVTSEPKPWAASGWSYDSGTRAITVTLRAGLSWSRGTAITPADLVTTFTRYGFTVSASGPNLVFSFAGGNAGRFFSEALYDWIAWNSAQVKMYSGLYSVRMTNASVLDYNPYYWAGRPYLDSISLVPTTMDGAACRLMRSHNASFRWGVDFIGFPVTSADLNAERSCSSYAGGFRDEHNNSINKSLSNANESRREVYVSAVSNPGPQFLYYWTDAAGSGPMADMNFRRAMYLLVNKQSAKVSDPASITTNSMISRLDSFWFLPSWEVVRDAGYTAAQDPDLVNRKFTNTFPGSQALDMAGYLDRNGDGWRETPTGAPLVVRVGVVDYNVDPHKTAIASDGFVVVLQRANVNATGVLYPSWADLRTAESSHAVDMALDLTDSATANPRFLETFAPLLSANDPNVALHLGLGRNATTLAERVLHYNYVTYYAALDADVLPILHYTLTDVYDRDAFQGWVGMFGGINNVWSFASLQLPQLGPLGITLSTDAATVTSGGGTAIRVVVLDSAGAGVANATVDLTVSAGVAAYTSGLTDANGRFSTEWTAPTVTDTLDVVVTATVYRPQYAGGTASTALTVHPTFRLMIVDVLIGNNTPLAGHATAVQVHVTSSGSDVAGAIVTLSVSLPGATLSKYSDLTPANGTVTLAFTAMPSVRSIYRIDVAASLAGYAPGSGSGSVIVNPKATEKTDYTTVTEIQNVPGFDTFLVVAALGVGIAVLRWRRREG